MSQRNLWFLGATLFVLAGVIQIVGDSTAMGIAFVAIGVAFVGLGVNAGRGDRTGRRP